MYLYYIMNIFYYITPFSPELIDIICSYLDKVSFSFLERKKHLVCKDIYVNYPGIERISLNRRENYIRWILRNDYRFLLEYSINYIINNNKKNIKYKNQVFKKYKDYINFLIHFYNSGKCKYLLSTVKST